MFIVINIPHPPDIFVCELVSLPQTWAGAMWHLFFVTLLYTRVLVWVLSRVWLFGTHQDYSPPGSSVHGISRARMLEWVAISFPTSPASPALTGGFFTSAPTGKPMGTSCQHLLLTKIFEEIRTGTWKSELGFWRGTNSSVISLTFSLQISGDFQRIYNLFCSEYKTKQNEKSWELPNKICHNST